ncbi:hypothetical protein G4B88_017836 [Cannabis sativa]|uniref:non-specific serine/threonine protein kinase n=1 Tax=Cannabis sativa TaxID=3483 RepID=A0A7J6GQ36_CANSA|nr:hypothetical protein G4B88_017836 [Cannabis sativa]
MPTMDMAKLFASRGLKATIVTTSYYAQNFSKTIEKSRAFLGTQVEVLTIKIPCSDVGLPEGIESVHMVSSPKIDAITIQTRRDGNKELMSQAASSIWHILKQVKGHLERYIKEEENLLARYDHHLGFQILRKPKHENIIEMLDSFESPQEFCVVTEFAQVNYLRFLKMTSSFPKSKLKRLQSS